MKEVTVAQLVVEAVRALGAPRIYGIIGTSILDFIDRLYDYRGTVDFVTTRHEQVAVSAADGEARVTGHPGVAAVHAGPGLLNSMISLGVAYRDRIPLLLLLGGVRRRLRGTEAWLEVDFETLAKPVSKGYVRIGSGPEAFERVREALEVVSSRPFSPVILEVPEDVWRETSRVPDNYVEKLREAASTFKPVPPSTENVKDIVEGLLSARKPVILACGELAYSAGFSQNLLLELTERTGAYIVVSGNGRGACPEDHPRCLGRVGFGGGNAVADYAFEHADYLLVLGNEFDDITTYSYNLLPEGDITVVSLDPAVDSRPPYYEHVTADPMETLNHLVNELRERNASRRLDEWDREVGKARARWEAVLQEALKRRYSNAVNPSRFFKVLDGSLPRDRVVAAGQGTHIVYVYDYVRMYQPRSFLAATNLGAMSYAFPAALGAKMAVGGREVVAVVGDGELMMVVQDIETIVREGVPVKLVLVNDDSYRVLYLRQRIQKQGRIYETVLGNPDFMKLASAFGIKGLRVDSDDRIESAVKALIESREPILVELVVDREDLPPLNLELTLKM